MIANEREKEIGERVVEVQATIGGRNRGETTMSDRGRVTTMSNAAATENASDCDKENNVVNNGGGVVWRCMGEYCDKQKKFYHHPPPILLVSLPSR